MFIMKLLLVCQLFMVIMSVKGHEHGHGHGHGHGNRHGHGHRHAHKTHVNDINTPQYKFVTPSVLILQGPPPEVLQIHDNDVSMYITPKFDQKSEISSPKNKNGGPRKPIIVSSSKYRTVICNPAFAELEGLQLQGFVAMWPAEKRKTNPYQMMIRHGKKMWQCQNSENTKTE